MSKRKKMLSKALPKRVRVIEVGPRDGFQMEDRFIPTDLKVEVIELLAAAGLRDIEATSFVQPRMIPQLADAAEVMARVRDVADVRWIALIPNSKGAERALAAGAQELRLVVCVTETYNRKNVGLSVEQSVDRFQEIVELACPLGVDVTAVLAVAFGCPFEGQVPEERVVELAARFANLGSAAIGLADTAGLGNPVQVRRVVGKLQERVGELPLWLHFHDTRGLGLANALVAMEEGITAFDTSLAGLGGCPVMRGASGNISTEDFVYMCSEMGVETGIELDGVRRASRRMAEFLGRALPSRVLAAGTREELVERNRSL